MDSKQPIRITKTLSPDQKLPIRITKTRTANQQRSVSPLATANVTYHNGPLIRAAQVYTIFWGAEWNQAPQNALVLQINQFFNFILTSSIMDLIREYSVEGQIIEHGVLIGTTIVTNSEPGGGSGQVTDSQIQQALQGWIANGTIPQPNSNSLYFVYLPPNVICNFNGSLSCNTFCGYHNYNTSVVYAVLPYLDCAGCLAPSQQVFDSLTKVTAHELCEVITDPSTSGWFDGGTGYEIADICNDNFIQLGGYTVQSMYSRLADNCQIQPPNVVYVKVGGIAGFDLSSSNDLIFTFDYNSVGKLDHLVLYRPGSGAIWIAETANGDFLPVFNSGHGIDGYDLSSPADLALAFDYDGSGKLDHMVLYRPGQKVVYILANTNGSFSAVFSSTNGIGGYNLDQPVDRIIAFDYSSSGKLDHLVLYRPGSKTIWILQNIGGTFSPVFSSNNGIGGYNLDQTSDQVFAFDYNSSGKLDHLVLYRPGNKIIWILQNINGTFTPVFSSNNGIGGYNLDQPSDRVFAFDYNGSGKLDHLVLYRPGNKVIWILQNINGTFTPVFSSNNGIGGFDLSSLSDKVFAFDYVSSGKSNYLTLYRPGSGIAWILANNNGTFTPAFVAP